VADDDITWTHRGEVRSKQEFRCARCGESSETKEQRTQRLAVLERSRREAEHNDVSIQRFPGFATIGTAVAKWGTREFFAQMSNQLRRRSIFVLMIIAIGFVSVLAR
jgi:chromosome segregation and condensation protein ScpB